MDLEDVFLAAGIDERSQNILKDKGVENLDCLFEIERDVKRKKISGIDDDTVKKLKKFYRWYEEFEDTRDREPGLADLSRFNSGFKLDCKDFSGLWSLLSAISNNPDTLKKFDWTPETHSEMIENAVHRVESLFPTKLRKSTSHFKRVYRSLMKRAAEHFWFEKDAVNRLPFLVGGRTQSGKTSFKATFALLCAELSIPLVIITKGVAESKELNAKIGDYLEDYYKTTGKVDCLSTPERGKRRDYMATIFKNGGCIVIADTAAQVNNACNAIEEYRGQDSQKRFAVIVDECDEMYRTEERTQKIEQAYDRLMDMNPLMEIQMSATLVPNLIELHLQRSEIGFFQFIEPPGDYVGQEYMKVLNDEGGNDVHLIQNELTFKTPTPFYNHKVKLLYQNANDTSAKGILLLDCSDPRVNAKGNISTKAKRVQRKFPRIIAVVFVGGGIRYKTPGLDGRSEWVEAKKGAKISEVLEDLDDKHGLEVPIFVFGFSKMQRGMSFRSSRRVPTHMLLAQGRGYSTEGLIQALGRATFNGLHVLEQNGFKHVTVLTQARDWDTAMRYQNFQLKLYRRSKKLARESTRFRIDELLEGTYQGHENFLGIRRIGKRKDYKSHFESNVDFNEIDIEDKRNKRICSGHLYLNSHYRDEDIVAANLIDILRTKKPAMIHRRCMEFDESELQEYYKDKYEDITLKELRDKLNELERQSITRKRKVDGKINRKTGKVAKVTMWSLKTK